MEEIGKERGTFRKGSRQDLDFQATLCVLFYEFSKLGEREGGLKLWYFPNPLGKVYGG